MRESSFESLVADLLLRLGREDVHTNVVFNRGPRLDFEVDILFKDAGKLTVVELKRYRYTSPPAPDLFLKAVRQINLLKPVAAAQHGILVMSCPLTNGLQSIARQYPNVEIWDAHELLKRASRYPDLLERLESLLEVKASDVLPGYIPVAQTANSEAPELSRGARLVRSLEDIEPGREDASRFEDACIDALKYLFNRDLFGWHPQHEAQDGLHRRDLVCRILPDAGEVWKLMLTDLKSRYVVFEFKNYSESITQHEIVTTERYLYPAAMRNVAIIISPHRCAPSAEQVIRGAMREQGKLILPLTVPELANLLIGMDSGTDPNTYLFERVDQFLMSLGR